ncbi:MAG: tetratricopeptide repeat protein [Candidatus Omnitrophota bacterium]
MDFLRLLTTASPWEASLFFLRLLPPAIFIGAVGISIYTIIQLLREKKIAAKIIFLIFAACYLIVCIFYIFSWNKTVPANFSKYGFTSDKYMAERLKRLTAAIKANPGDANNYFSRGMLYANNFYYDQALNDFQQALNLNPNLPIANNYVCYIYANKRQFNKAEGYCQKAIEQSPNFSKPYFNLARIYRHRKDLERAVAQISKAIELEKTNYEPYIFRAEVFYDKGEYAKAIDDLKKAIELNAPDRNFLKRRINTIQQKAR